MKVNSQDPERLLAETEEEIASEHYILAIEKLRSIKTKFPRTPYAATAQLRIGDVYYAQESFIESGVAYEAFCELYPRHPKVNYARFRVAKSYINQIPSTIARDLSPASRAITAYHSFTKLYPHDPLVEEARQDIKKIRELLAEKELYIADFYKREGIWESAKTRYEKICQLYDDTRSAKRAHQALGK